MNDWRERLAERIAALEGRGDRAPAAAVQRRSYGRREALHRAHAAPRLRSPGSWWSGGADFHVDYIGPAT
jgi:hypothetical protein